MQKFGVMIMSGFAAIWFYLGPVRLRIGVGLDAGNTARRFRAS